MWRSALGMMLALLAAGCTADGPAFEPVAQRPRGEGIIYVYRPSGQTIGRGESPYIEIAGTSMGMLKAGGYMSLAVPPGEHEVTARQALFFIPTIWDTVTVAVAPGSVSYVRVDQRVTKIANAGTFSAMQQVSIEEVPTDVGQSEIADTKQN